MCATEVVRSVVLHEIIFPGRLHRKEPAGEQPGNSKAVPTQIWSDLYYPEFPRANASSIMKMQLSTAIEGNANAFLEECQLDANNAILPRVFGQGWS